MQVCIINTPALVTVVLRSRSTETCSDAHAERGLQISATLRSEHFHCTHDSPYITHIGKHDALISAEWLLVTALTSLQADTPEQLVNRCVEVVEAAVQEYALLQLRMKKIADTWSAWHARVELYTDGCLRGWYDRMASMWQVRMDIALDFEKQKVQRKEHAKSKIRFQARHSSSSHALTTAVKRSQGESFHGPVVYGTELWKL